MSNDEIQIFVNLEPSSIACSNVNTALNFQTFYNHLLRAVEIPMIQFLEQLYNEASTRAQKDPSTTPREFQILLREFVREPSHERQQVFLEHIKAGKHTIEHLGTMALLAVRSLTQSLAAGDFELVTLAQSSTTDVARYYVQTGMTYEKLFLAAITEAARQVDRNPMYFARNVKSKQYLENRKMIRAQIASALRASIDDISIKAYSSLRQHIAEKSLKSSNSNNALTQETRADAFAFPTRNIEMSQMNKTAPPVQKQQQQQQKQQQQQQQPTQTTVAIRSPPATGSKMRSPPTTPPLVLPKNNSNSAALVNEARNVTVADFDQRASPMASDDAKVAQNDFVQTMLTVSNKANQIQKQPKTQVSVRNEPSTFGTGRVQLENNTTRSAETPKLPPTEAIRANSTGAILDEKTTIFAPALQIEKDAAAASESGDEQSEQNIMESVDLLTKDEE